MSGEQRQQAGSPWGSLNPQALNRSTSVAPVGGLDQITAVSLPCDGFDRLLHIGGGAAHVLQGRI